ncbi:hypothetical protein [Acidipila rosea]|uniref:O-antigen ligase n=1 Tax=Acidipila rosea TaxID=768535 RepID=A0A4R1KZU7_9BACT|nr:hypothetical protein [Acidipila rosea]TCK70150.1 hypothetical protein C7378_3305 [Acidipila rosea]
MLNMLIMAAVGLGVAWVMYYAVGAAAGSLKVGLGALVVTFLTTTALSGSQGLQLGINIYPEDLVCTVLFLAATVRYLVNFKFLEWKRFLAVSGMILTFVESLRGALEVGVKPAGQEARGWFYTFAVLLYVLSFVIGEEEWNEILISLRWMTFGIMVIAICRWGMIGTGLANSAMFAVPGDESAGGGLRVVPSICALAVAESFLIESFYLSRRPQTRWSQITPLVLIVSVVLLQHRTLWVGLMAPIFWLGLKDKNFRRYSIVIVAATGVGLLIILTTNIAPALREALTLSATSDGTMLWRINSWQGTISNWQNSDAISHIFGIPFGVANPRVMSNGTTVDMSSHDYLVDTLARLGAAGVVLVIVLLLGTFWQSLKLNYSNNRGQENPGRIMVALMLLIFGYCVTYGPDYYQMALIGSILAYSPTLSDKQFTIQASPVNSLCSTN